jgi:hypothetical protein
MGLFRPLMREFMEMHYLQTTPVLMDGSPLTALIGPIKKTSYAEAIALTSGPRAMHGLPGGEFPPAALAT